MVNLIESSLVTGGVSSPEALTLQDVILRLKKLRKIRKLLDVYCRSYQPEQRRRLIPALFRIESRIYEEVRLYLADDETFNRVLLYLEYREPDWERVASFILASLTRRRKPVLRRIRPELFTPQGGVWHIPVQPPPLGTVKQAACGRWLDEGRDGFVSPPWGLPGDKIAVSRQVYRVVAVEAVRVEEVWCWEYEVAPV